MISRQRYWVFALLVAVLLLNSLPYPAFSQDSGAAQANPPAAKGPIKVGSKEFSEQLLLGKMIILLLRNAGFEVEDKTGTGGSPAVRAALESGEIDLYPEYTGTAVALYHNLPGSALPSDEERLYILAKSLDAEQGLVWLNRAKLNNTYTLMVRQDLIDQGVKSLKELATYMNANDSKLKICVESEFYSREQDGIKGLEKRYGFQFKQENVLLMDLNEAYDKLRTGECEIAEGYATDGRIPAWGFYNLEDDLNYFPIYNPAPVVRKEILDKYPEITDLLNALGQYLDNETMSKLNARVDLGNDGKFSSGDEETVENVALNFLQSVRLLNPPTIKVGSKEFTEQLILGKMLVLLLKDAGYEVEDKTGIGGSPAVRAALESGEIDVYPEYTGTGLSLHNNLPGAALPTDPDRAWELVKSLDERKGLVWLDRAALNDTYTLMARQDLLDKGIKSLEDLAKFMNANDAPLTVCIESEFYSREQDGIKGLETRYGFQFKQDKVQLMDLNETYQMLREGKCDLAEGYSTDGRIAAWGFHNLEDTLNFFPIYNPAPVVRKEVLDRTPEVADLFNRIAPFLNNEAMAKLNARVDLGEDGVAANGDEESVENVAYSFLRSHRLLKPPKITVAGKDYTEQLILGNMVVLLLQNAGYEVINKVGMGGSKVVRQAMENGEVDVYVELTGSALAVHNGLPSDALPTSANRSYALAKALDGRKGIVWLDRGAFNDTYAMMVRNDLWDQGIKTLEDLAKYMNENSSPLSVCVENDFFGREQDGFPGLQKQYGFEFQPDKVLLMDLDGAYEGLRNKDCDVAEGYSTDGRGVAYGFHNLEDTLAFFPFYNPAAVVRKTVLEANPELRDILGPFAEKLDDVTMSKLNARVDIGADGKAKSGDEETSEAVARDFLLKEGLITEANLSQAPAPQTSSPAPSVSTTPIISTTEPVTTTESITPAPAITSTAPITTSNEVTATTAVTKTSSLNLPATTSPVVVSATATSPVVAGPAVTGPAVVGPVVVGSSPDRAEALLGAMYVLILKDAGYQVTDQIGTDEPPALRAALDKGQLDLYPELSGRALTLYHDLSASALPTDADRSYALAKSLDQPQGIIWLNRGFFNQSRALLARPEVIALGVKSIGDLATLAQKDVAAVKLCVDNDDPAQAPDELNAWQTRYGLTLPEANVLRLSATELYPALRKGECNVAMGSATAGAIAAWGFQVLEDNLAFFSSNVAAPVARQALLDADPGVATLFDKLGEALNNNSMRLLNALVELGPDGEPDTQDEADISTVAQAFLCHQKLIQTCPSALLTLELQPLALPIIAPITPTLALSATDVLSVTIPSIPTPEAVTRVIISTPATNGVNARQEPSTTATVLQLLPANTLVPATGRTQDNAWLHIQLADGRLAWVFTTAMLFRPEAVEKLPVVEQ